MTRRWALAALAATVVAGAAGRARGDRAKVAVVWLDGGQSPLVAEVAGALAASKDVRPLDDATLVALLVEGGPSTQVLARLALARTEFAAGRCSAAIPHLDAARAVAELELPVGEARPLVGEAAALGLLCADLARDDAAAARAARLLGMSGRSPSPELAAALARHPLPVATPQPAVMVESDPAGATVFVDLVAVGKTPLSLPASRLPDAVVDLELTGYRRVHRVAPAPGTLAVALTRDDRPGPLVDRLRADAGNAPEAVVADLGRRVAADRVLVARLDPDRAGQVQVRLLDVAQVRWARPSLSVPLAGAAARIERYASLAKEPEPVVAGAPTAPVPDETPAWKRWYTWVGAGVLVALVLGVVIANHVGSDQLTVAVHH